MQRRRGLDAELIHEHGPGVPIDRERVRLPAAAVEREHQLSAEALMQRLLGHELLQLADELGVAAQRELGLDPLPQRRQPQLLEPGDRRLGERLVGEVRERSAAPEGERVAQKPRRGFRLAAPEYAVRLLRQALEAVEIELPWAEPEHVARWARLDRGGLAERLAQLGYLPLDLRDRGRGRRAGVEVVGKPVDRDDPVRVQQQERQRRALPRAPERDGPSFAGDLERSQDAELQDVGTVAPR